MNWFLYVGGGIIWMFVIPALFVGLLDRKLTVGAIHIIAWAMVWIWICWRFIA